MFAQDNYQQTIAKAWELMVYLMQQSKQIKYWPILPVQDQTN